MIPYNAKMKKILVIEDEALLRKGVSEILTYEGFQVFEAENGENGILFAQTYHPDLILCDILMPVMDGSEVLSRIRKSEKTKLIPFVFMTALSERSDLRTGMELGSDDYITKPYTREELLTAINTRLKKSTEIANEKESSLNELRDNIMHHLPHELRTPLNGMIGFGQLLMDYPQTYTHEELAGVGKNIYDSSMRLYRLIQNYLMYAQLEVKTKESVEVVKLKALDKICRSVAEEIAQVHNREADLVFHRKEGEVYTGNSDFLKITEELTDNAFKFSMPGDKVEVGCSMEEGNFHLSVKDKGRGIAANDLPKIGAYMQFDRDYYEQQGSGLGLIITKKIVDLYDGKMLIDSTVGKGTSILVSLP